MKSWEYWHLSWLYVPVFIYGCWLAIKSKDPAFFSTANPLIPTGGLFGSSKFDILKDIPAQWKPETYYSANLSTEDDILQSLEQNNINFPAILKPDMAERGVGVQVLKSNEDLIFKKNKISYPVVIQNFIQLPLEFGIFFIKNPNSKEGRIVSVVQKEFLTVTGDGKSTIAQLMKMNDRSFLTLEKWIKVGNPLLEKVPALSESLIIEPIGNHNRGTKFLNANHLINEEMNEVFTRICKHIPEFYYGRLDLKCGDISDLYSGENIKIMEVNGINSEPAHIYDPTISYLTGLKTVLSHWDEIYTIAKINKQRGFSSNSVGEVWNSYKRRMDTVHNSGKEITT